MLSYISQLRLLFQCEDIDLSLIQPALEVTIISMEEFHTNDLQEVYDTISNDLQQYNITVTDSNKQHFRVRVQHKFINAVIDQLKELLPDCEELSAFAIIILS